MVRRTCLRKPAHRLQHAQLAPAVRDGHRQRVHDAQHGHQHRDRDLHVGDSEPLIGQSQNVAAHFAIGQHEQPPLIAELSRESAASRPLPPLRAPGRCGIRSPNRRSNSACRARDPSAGCPADRNNRVTMPAIGRCSMPPGLGISTIVAQLEAAQQREILRSQHALCLARPAGTSPRYRLPPAAAWHGARSVRDVGRDQHDRRALDHRCARRAPVALRPRRGSRATASPMRFRKTKIALRETLRRRDEQIRIQRDGASIRRSNRNSRAPGRPARSPAPATASAPPPRPRFAAALASGYRPRAFLPPAAASASNGRSARASHSAKVGVSSTAASTARASPT